MREFIYSGDAAEAVARLLKSGYTEPLNIGTGIGTSIKELAELVARLTGFRGEIVWDTIQGRRRPAQGARRLEDGERPGLEAPDQPRGRPGPDDPLVPREQGRGRRPALNVPACRIHPARRHAAPPRDDSRRNARRPAPRPGPVPAVPAPRIRMRPNRPTSRWTIIIMKFVEYFDRTCIINLPERADRLRLIRKELSRCGLDDHPEKVQVPFAPKPDDAHDFTSKGVYGSYLSHYNILKDALRDGIRTVWVLEDDATFSHRMVRDQARIVEFLQADPWDMCFFGHSLHRELKGMPRGLIHHTAGFRWAHCYAIHSRVLPRLIAYLEENMSNPRGDPRGGKMYIDAAYTLFPKVQPGRRVAGRQPPDVRPEGLGEQPGRGPLVRPIETHDPPGFTGEVGARRVLEAHGAASRLAPGKLTRGDPAAGRPLPHPRPATRRSSARRRPRIGIDPRCIDPRGPAALG